MSNQRKCADKANKIASQPTFCFFTHKVFSVLMCYYLPHHVDWLKLDLYILDLQPTGKALMKLCSTHELRDPSNDSLVILPSFYFNFKHVIVFYNLG